MDQFIVQAIVIAVGLFSVGLMIVLIRVRDAAPVGVRPRSPSRRVQSDAALANLFRPGRS